MQIAIVGYGKMGKRIEQIALERGHSISVKIDSSNREDIRLISRDHVAIEFTSPTAAIDNYRELAANKIATVTGTTGWHDREDDVFQAFKDSGTPFFHASNFSVGVHIFRSVNTFLAKAMSQFPEYRASINEWHHTEKKDSPSGTAITLGKDLIAANKNYNALAPDRDAGQGELPVTGHREKDVTGKHIVEYKSDIDQITIEHEAFNRDGFALGAVLAAEFIKDQSDGIFTMNDLIKLNA